MDWALVARLLSVKEESKCCWTSSSRRQEITSHWWTSSRHWALKNHPQAPTAQTQQQLVPMPAEEQKRLRARQPRLRKHRLQTDQKQKFLKAFESNSLLVL